jgi:hypothetical protein
MQDLTRPFGILKKNERHFDSFVETARFVRGNAPELNVARLQSVVVGASGAVSGAV